MKKAQEKGCWKYLLFLKRVRDLLETKNRRRFVFLKHSRFNSSNHSVFFFLFSNTMSLGRKFFSVL